MTLSDILSAVQITTHASYSGDTTLAQTIQILRIIAYLRQDFNAIYRWAEENSVEFNAEKF